MEAATDAKLAVEDAQRDQRRKMEETGEKYVSRFFTLRDGQWIPKLEYVTTLYYGGGRPVLNLIFFFFEECPVIQKQQFWKFRNGYSTPRLWHRLRLD